ncbi:capsid assembly scaffolding protein Gp46 family protein [Psychrobacillus lasiicapitis]|uniref:DUF4355 domain-containing protein n=1 Tax=Psychrobacillus lasiicapitis TaxID=1636719 RepID=A0A544TAG4_9BACI|nr:DUF4355 domain-containing protein [Psychrobacillus lasiicapitis]TQR14461.1 DUF4355 domain-containing protein [Psychrobacillus lasiicapitis]GGA31137.1 hypothetical protein GCM10011384_20800 [Psychrobacillus lasiicapitis]
MLEMKKKERLAVKINQFDGDSITFDQVKTFLDTHKDSAEVKAYYKSNVLTADNVKTFLETSEAKKVLQPKLDAHFTKSLETWKTNNLDSLIEEEVKKRNPDETPEQKRIRELEEKLQSQEKESKLSKLKETALKHATKQGLDSAFASKYIERFIGDDETATTTLLDELKTDLDGLVNTQVDARFKENGRHIEHGSGNANVGSIDIGKLAADASIRN